MEFVDIKDLATCAQPGVLTNPTTFADYLTFVLNDKQEITAEVSGEALAELTGIEKSINQKDPDAGLTMTVGFSLGAWQSLFSSEPTPKELRPFTPMKMVIVIFQPLKAISL